MWPVLARCVFPLKSMSYDVNDSAEYPQIVNARNAMGQRKIWLDPIKLGTGKIKESTIAHLLAHYEYSLTNFLTINES